MTHEFERKNLEKVEKIWFKTEKFWMKYQRIVKAVCNPISTFYGCSIFSFMTIFFNTKQQQQKWQHEKRTQMNMRITSGQNESEIHNSRHSSEFISTNGRKTKLKSVMYEIRKYYQKIRIHFYIRFFLRLGLFRVSNCTKYF